MYVQKKKHKGENQNQVHEAKTFQNLKSFSGLAANLQQTASFKIWHLDLPVLKNETTWFISPMIQSGNSWNKQYSR